MASTIIFLITACIGVLTTQLVLRKNRKSGVLSHHRQALILSLGYGLTPTISFLASILLAGSNSKIDTKLIPFSMIYTLFFVISMYGAVRLLLYFLHKKKVG